jgi:orotate phosphoribosyltransferase
MKAIEAAEAEGHVVVAVICLVDREEGGAAKLAAYPFHPIFRRSDIFDDLDKSDGARAR